jgi:hypothetical protein
MNIFEQTGGARLDGINVSYPLAKLSVTTEAIRIRYCRYSVMAMYAAAATFWFAIDRCVGFEVPDIG